VKPGRVRWKSPKTQKYAFPMACQKPVTTRDVQTGKKKSQLYYMSLEDNVVSFLKNVKI